jgi:hypothetical protein
MGVVADGVMKPLYLLKGWYSFDRVQISTATAWILEIWLQTIMMKKYSETCIQKHCTDNQRWHYFLQM